MKNYLLCLFSFYLVFGHCNVVVNRNFAATGADFTIVSGSNGEDVVFACIQRIENLGIFTNDFGLMQRIAKAETNFGRSYSSKDPSKGIWQAPTSAIPLLHSNSGSSPLASPISTIRSYLGGEFVDFNNLDQTIPLHSAIIARLYIQLLLNNTDAPATLSEQASWWASSYRPGGDSSLFMSETTGYEATKGCPSKAIDLWFLLDASSSIGETHFHGALNFINHIVKQFTVSPNNLRVGMSVYSYDTSITTISKLDEHTSNAAFETAVNATTYQRGRTFTGAAISDVINNGLNEANGARPYSEGVPRILVLLTDGYSSDSVVGPAYNAHAAGITVISIGVSIGVVADELFTIASYPHSTYAYNVPEFEDLIEALGQRLSLQLCEVSAGLPYNSLASLVVPTGTTHYSYIRVPTSGHVTLILSASPSGGSSNGHMYLSTLPNPTSSLYLANVNILQGAPVSLIISATSPTSLARSGITETLTVTGHDPSADSVPLYFSTSSQGGGDFRMGLESVYTPEETTTTTSPSTATIPPTAESTPLEAWVVIVIVIGVLLALVIAVAVVLIAVGVHRSSSSPKWSDNIMFSVCCCVVSSAGY